MTRAFVTASGTEVGKTLVTTALVHQLRGQGRSVSALKPVLSGFDPEGPSDAHEILAALGRPLSDLEEISPWRFAAPLSPDAAAAREGRTVPFDDLVAFCRQGLASDAEAVLIEGVGGAFVPLDATHTVADWITALGLPAIVVTGSYLGSLSHTIATVEAMRARGIEVAALVVSESADAALPLDETVATLAQFLPGTTIHALPRIVPAGNDPLRALAPDLTAVLSG